MDNTYLQHYGVLGMKWGVRKAKKNGDSSYKYKSWKTKTQEFRRSFHPIDSSRYKTLDGRVKRSAKLDAKKQEYYTKKKNRTGARKKASTYRNSAALATSMLGTNAASMAIAAKVSKNALRTSMASGTKFAGVGLSAGVGISLVSSAVGAVGYMSMKSAYETHRSFGDNAVAAALKTVAGGPITSRLRERHYIYHG